MSYLKLVFDAILNLKRELELCESGIQHCSLCLPDRLIRTIQHLLSLFICQEKTWSEVTYQNSLWCLTLQSRRWALFRPPCSSKQISQPDKSTVLFFPVTNPSSKRRAKSLHQPLVMAMKWTCACFGATVAASSQHTNVASKKTAATSQSTPHCNQNCPSCSCLSLEIYCWCNISALLQKNYIVLHAVTGWKGCISCII